MSITQKVHAYSQVCIKETVCVQKVNYAGDKSFLNHLNVKKKENNRKSFFFSKGHFLSPYRLAKKKEVKYVHRAHHIFIIKLWIRLNRVYRIDLSHHMHWSRFTIKLLNAFCYNAFGLHFRKFSIKKTYWLIFHIFPPSQLTYIYTYIVGADMNEYTNFQNRFYIEFWL